MSTSDVLYANRIFLNGALPLLKVIVESKPGLTKSFQGMNTVLQVSALNGKEKVGTHFIVEDGQWQVVKGITNEADIDLQFPSMEALNGFFSGTSKKLPKIIGWYHVGLLIKFLKALLSMANLLGAVNVPKDEDEKELLVKLYFYLLSSGVSQLNKATHPEVSKWAKKSPDRVYAWAVNDRPDLSAYIRVKAGKTKACRGEYKRSKPFFTMRFSDVESALGILLQIDDFLDATVKGKMIMEGAPEYGAMIGDFMMMIGSYAKGG
ncbi:hypothetical protein [Vallitalea okinawensis]|uniref:hypothetical protein n=1 Tax=Vallitalea okinawensis TaxID=2078660 RepID=UPI000CFBB315|nr:hypothetical protein [Vallitalea okinawensis]